MAKLTTKEIVARLKQLPTFAGEPTPEIWRVRKSKFPSYYESQYADFKKGLRIVDVPFAPWCDEEFIEPNYDKNYVLDLATVRVFHSVSVQDRTITVISNEKDENIVAIYINED